MTPKDKILWDYIDEESNDLLLRLNQEIKDDGFTGSGKSEEVIAMKVLSAAMIKTLAITCEKINHPCLATAYMQTIPLHTELIKIFLMKQVGRNNNAVPKV
jgi:hypothetical protein